MLLIWLHQYIIFLKNHIKSNHLFLVTTCTKHYTCTIYHLFLFLWKPCWKSWMYFSPGWIFVLLAQYFYLLCQDNFICLLFCCLLIYTELPNIITRRKVLPNIFWTRCNEYYVNFKSQVRVTSFYFQVLKIVKDMKYTNEMCFSDFK